MISRPKILVHLISGTTAYAFTEAHAERLRRLLPEADVSRVADENALLAALPEADAAVVWTFRQEWFDLAPRLRILATPAAAVRSTQA